jgi:hypothetical protein
VPWLAAISTILSKFQNRLFPRPITQAIDDPRGGVNFSLAVIPRVLKTRGVIFGAGMT